MIELVIVSRLLEYPDAALWQHQQEMFEALASSEKLSKEDAHALGVFLRDLVAQDPLDAQAAYSELFDRGRATSLAPILGLLSARLQQRESRYAVLFELLLKLANTQVDSQKVAEKIADEARDDTPQALDAVWEEEQVKFFADQGCGESEISAHQRRFAGAVAPQYLNISNGGQQ